MAYEENIGCFELKRERAPRALAGLALRPGRFAGDLLKNMACGGLAARLLGSSARVRPPDVSIPFRVSILAGQGCAPSRVAIGAGRHDS
jgi:hypothetical protein